MISNYDKQLLTEAGREYILDITLDSRYLKEQLTFKDHVLLCDQVKKLTYEEVIALTITEDIRDFEGKFGKFLKYSIAAIAGAKFMGLGMGPPLAMFVLYLYRKLTDTCIRSCFRKFPLSKQRKICKLECQLEAAKKMERDIRSEISKCSQFQYADKCEKKLQKEYIKWAKRVQKLQVRLNLAKTDIEEKRRKAKQKELSKRAKTLRANVELPKKQIINFISENTKLRKELPFRKHLELYNIAQNIEEQDENPPEVSMPKINPKKEKRIRMAMYLGLWVVPIPFFNDVINYYVKKYQVSCIPKCVKSGKLPRNVCYNQCSYLSAKYAADVLKKELGKCGKSKDPVKCKRKIYNLMEDWKQREAERKIKFEASIKRETQKARAKNLKMKNKRGF